MTDPMRLASYHAKARKLIKEYGWMIQGVFDLDGKVPPYLYTAGLTEAGLPELVITNLHPDEVELGQALLNAMATLSLETELEVGQTYTVPASGGGQVRIEEAVVSDDLYPGTARALYGPERVRLLRVVPILD